MVFLNVIKTDEAIDILKNGKLYKKNLLIILYFTQVKKYFYQIDEKHKETQYGRRNKML